MYSVLLMAALATPPAAQGHCFHGHHRHGCYGCHSCYGCSYYGYSCHGCYWGGACYGCYGCGWGWGCHGCYGCYGWWGGHHHGVVVCHGCYGCYGGHSCYGMPIYGHVEPAAPSGAEPRRPDAKPGKVETTPPPKEGLEQARARITIDVPAEAKLYIDGQLTNSTSTRRVFQTPNLKAGSLYFYDVRVEVVRDGKVVSESQRIILRPGQETAASFASLGQDSPPAAAQRAED